MKKLTLTAIIASILLLANATAAELPGVKSKVFAGYTSKKVNFGKVTDTDGDKLLGADLSWQSFRLGALAHNDLTIGSNTSYKLNRIDLTGGYKFFSTLADVELGTTLEYTNKPGALDTKTHWQPFVSVGKSDFNVTGTYDVQSSTFNFEGKVKGPSLDLLGGKVVTGLFVGYTDVNDALPKSLQEIKYTNTYFGGSVDLTYKWFSVGTFVIRDGDINDTTVGWRAFATYQF